MNTFIFILTLFLPSFGGHVDVEFRTKDLESCLKLQKVIQREIKGMSFIHTLADCQEKKPHEITRLE